MLIDSSAFAFVFRGAVISAGAASAWEYESHPVAPPGEDRRITLSETISVLYLFTPAVSSQLRVLRYPSTYTFFPLCMYCSAISASPRHATQLWYSTSSWSMPDASFHLRLVATENVATFWPFGVSRTSGSAVRFPMICTLLSELLMWWWVNVSRKYTVKKYHRKMMIFIFSTSANLFSFSHLTQTVSSPKPCWVHSSCQK